ncbi:hypothetical protein LSTR_LSTR007080 [Laodelphax striatellus]|uniref:C2H2-type domain-containing protein n=1 Tax=Laodelphax striatellus TaxID=195883 RepID=A0A482WFB8_LAOST|nr:hypothetical protein LSTR_LSTR007080 [Laodelphax striatellus]
MSKGTSKSLSDKKDNSDDSDSSIDSISSSSSWKIEPKVEKFKTSQSSPKVISFSDSSSDCSDETYEAKVLSYLSGISIQQNTKTEEKSFSIPKSEVDNASSSSWESDSSMEPSFRYSSKTLAKKRIWEALERTMEEDNEMRQTKKLKKKRKPPSSPEKVPNEVYVDAGLRRNLTMQQIQISHLAKRDQNNGQTLERINSNPDHKPAFSVNDLERTIKDLETLISEWFCEICNANFETKSLLNSHMVNKHEGFVNYLCQNCAHPFYEATHYNSHYQREHNNKTALVFCYLCKKTDFSRFETLLEHLQTEHVTPDLYRVECVKCSEVFVSHEVLTRHYCEKLEKCHKNLIPRFNDKQTRIKFEENTSMKHQHRSTSMNVIECEYCGSTFHQSKYLRQHLAVHHRVLDVFECYICNKIFGAKYRLAEHFKRVHSGASYMCETCGKSYQTRFTLSTHMKKHTGDFDVFTCVECNQVFKRKQLMADHVSDMNKKCLWCDKMLNCRTKLLEHIDEKHRRLGRLECTECRRDVHSLTKFWNHFIVNHPEQCRLVNRNCVICEKCRQLCSSRHHLKKHQRKVCVLSEKHVCKYCNIRFGSNYLSTVHLKKVLRCALCGKSFECLTFLKEHVYFGHSGCGGGLKGSDWEKICCKGSGDGREKYRSRERLPGIERSMENCQNNGVNHEKQLIGCGKSTENCQDKGENQKKQIRCGRALENCQNKRENHEKQLTECGKSTENCENNGETHKKQMRCGRSVENCQNKDKNIERKLTVCERSMENCQNKGENQVTGCGRSLVKFERSDRSRVTHLLRCERPLERCYNSHRNLETHLSGCERFMENCQEDHRNEKIVSDCETSMEDSKRSDRKLSECVEFTENCDRSVEKEKESLKNCQNSDKNGLKSSEIERVPPSLRSYRRNLVDTNFKNVENKVETLLSKNGVRKCGRKISNDNFLENSNLSKISKNCDGTTKYVPYSNQMSKRIPNCSDSTTGCNLSNNERLSKPSKIAMNCDENSNETILKNGETGSMDSLKSSLSPKSEQSGEESFRTLQSCEETSRISSSTFDDVSDESNDSIRDRRSLISNKYTRDLDCVDSRNELEFSVDSSKKLYKYKCYDCDDRYYKTLNDIECHQRLAHDDSDDDVMICDHCGKQFSKRPILEGHFRKRSCSICGSKFGCWSLLKFHCTAQHKTGEWACDKCSRRFRTSLTLGKHASNCF